MALDPGILEAVANSNFKHIAEAPVLEAQRNTKAVNVIAETALATSVGNLQTVDVKEAAAISGVIRTDLSPQIATLAAAVSSIRSFLAGVVVSPGTGNPS